MAAIATILSFGCQLVCKIFFVKSRLSTLTSSLIFTYGFWPFNIVALRLAFSDGDWLPFCCDDEVLFISVELTTFFGRSSWRGLLCSREHSYINSFFVLRLKDLKKLLYEPVRMWLQTKSMKIWEKIRQLCEFIWITRH